MPNVMAMPSLPMRPVLPVRQIRSIVIWEVIVEDVTEVRNVNTTSCDVSGHENINIMVLNLLYYSIRRPCDTSEDSSWAI